MTRLSHTLSPGLQVAMERLEASIRARGPMVVACSGGVDSGLLAYVAHRVLEGRMLCVLGVSPSLARSEADEAVAFFERHGLPHVSLATHEMDAPGYRANGPDRCYFCNHELLQRHQASD